MCYVKQKVLKNDAVCWERNQWRIKFACKAKLHVLDDQIIKETNDHTHSANRGEVQASKVRQEMKQRARETEETPQQIISNAVAHLDDHAAVTMPTVRHIRTDIRRHHAVSSGLSPQHQHVKNTNQYTNPHGFFKNHQPTRGYTGNHCTVSKLCTWETMKIFKNRNTKILLWGFLSGGGFVLGYMSGVFLSYNRMKQT